MAAGSNSQQTLRKAVGAIKDSTMVGMAKVNSEFKALDVAILKATNHVEALPKEKHVRTILGSVSGSRARADVMYCIQTLARRLQKTRTWIVALKTLIVIHRALREVDHSFCEELIRYNNSRGHMLNLLHFKDESSPSAWDYSIWIRTYSLYLEECLECFNVLKYDFYRDHSRTKKFDTPDLLEQLPAMQELLFRLLACQPYGSARYNFIIQYALSIVAAESVRLYVSITDGVLILVDKFFEMQRRDAVRALDIYKKSAAQAEKLSEFFEICRSLEFGRRQKYVKIEQPPASFLAAMEEYAKDAPQTLMLQWIPDEEEGNGPKSIVVKGGDAESDSNENSDTGGAKNEETDNTNVEAPPLIPDLLSWEEASPESSIPNENDPATLLLTGPEDPSNATINSEESSEPAGWELALVTTPPTNQSKINVLDRSTLDRLYELALVPKPEPQNTADHMGGVSSNPFETDIYNQEMSYPPSHMETPNYMYMPGYPEQQAQYQQQGPVVGPDYMQFTGIPQQRPTSIPPHQQAQSIIGPDYLQFAGIPEQQSTSIPPHQQQVQSIVGPDYMQFAGIPQQQAASVPQHQQEEQSIVGPDYMHFAGLPQQQASSVPPNQQEEQSIAGPDQMQFAEIPQQQAASVPSHQQEEQSIVGPDYVQIAGIPPQQSPSVPPPQDEQSMESPDYMQAVGTQPNDQQKQSTVGPDNALEVEIPMQKEVSTQPEQDMFDNDTTNSVGNPFLDQDFLPNEPQSQTPKPSVTSTMSLI